MSLATKYRPKNLEDLFGNKDTISKLNGLFARPPFPNSVLLSGVTGTGKTTTARIIADKLGCSLADYREIDTADHRGIDNIRDIIRKVGYKPMDGMARVYVIDECHKLTTDAQNAFLKLLEEPPDYAYFILCTTEPEKLIPTLRGRCSHFEFKPLDEKDTVRLLRHVAKSEGEKLTKEIYDQIVDSSGGLPRNALQILEQVLAVDEDKRLEAAKQESDQKAQSIELCRALLGSASLKKVNTILKGLKDQDPESIRRHVLGYAQAVILNGSNASDRAALVIQEFYEPFWNVGFAGVVFASYAVTRSGGI